MDSREVTFVEVVLAAEDPSVETELWRVTDTLHLKVPVDLDPELVAALIDAIARC